MLIVVHQILLISIADENVTEAKKKHSFLDLIARLMNKLCPKTSRVHQYIEKLEKFEVILSSYLVKNLTRPNVQGNPSVMSDLTSRRRHEACVANSTCF